MKKMAIVCLLLLTGLATSASAEVRAGSFTVEPFVGGYTFDGIEHLRTRPIYGIRGGYNFTRNLGLEGLFHYNATELTRVGGDNDTKAYSYRLEGLYHFMPENRLVPFVALGFGGITVDYPSNLGSPYEDRTNAVFGWGGGLKYYLTDMIALRGDARHLLVTNRSTSNWEYTVGVNFQFGGEQAAPKAAVPPPAPVPAPMVEPAPAPAPPPPPAPAPAPKEMVKYCIPLKIEFDIDKADIRPQYHEEIGRVADFMKKYPTTTAVIEGHTDNVGTSEHNMELSQRRADSVVTYLVDKYGIERSRLSAKGYGYSRPVADNATEEGRQKNRRMEAVIDCALIDAEQYARLPKYLCISMNIEFDTDQAVVKPMYDEKIATVADFLKKHPTTTAVLEGHTDNVGAADYNMKLSQRRAEAVVNYLVDKFGIERSRLSAKGYGETRPVGYNTDPAGRAMNRRVDAVIDCAVE
ncbi:OmpA family protein [Geobacter pickeringii]|uniref:Membrane protein n=1 Tax=Geobacter pickeringii TaxID=345632 RepID=A0A0B5B7L5_9BACT|nr:OmpA family protein [Geobacter pickeringii]AJE02567.1 membrane protein [Geobacter pickeringii]